MTLHIVCIQCTIRKLNSITCVVCELGEIDYGTSGIYGMLTVLPVDTVCLRKERFDWQIAVQNVVTSMQEFTGKCGTFQVFQIIMSVIDRGLHDECRM